MNFTLTEARKRIVEVDRIEFVEKTIDGLTKIDYAFVAPGTFVDENGDIDPLLCELRGIIFDKETGKIVARGIHKFFNIDEKPITSFRNFARSKIHCEEKLDGTMIQVFKYKNEIRITTKGSLERNLYVKLAWDIINHNPYLNSVIYNILQEDVTIIFELTSPENPIIIPYKDYNLTLLAIRDNKSGVYMNMNKLSQVKLPKVYDFYDIISACDFIKKTEGIEGFVIKNISTGVWAKLKTPWYLKRHNLYSISLLSVGRVVKMILNEDLDDILGNIEDSIENKSIALRMWDEVMGCKDIMIKEINKEWKLTIHLTDKELGMSDLKYKKFHFARRKCSNYEEIIDKGVNRIIHKEYLEKYKNVRLQQYFVNKTINSE